MSDKPWAKIYSENYEDHLVGNAEGLSKLKIDIDKAINENHADLSIESDFLGIVCSKSEWQEVETNQLKWWQEKIIISLVLFWVLVLPLLGVVTLFKWLF